MRVGKSDPFAAMGCERAQLEGTIRDGSALAAQNLTRAYARVGCACAESLSAARTKGRSVLDGPGRRVVAQICAGLYVDVPRTRHFKMRFGVGRTTACEPASFHGRAPSVSEAPGLRRRGVSRNDAERRVFSSHCARAPGSQSWPTAEDIDNLAGFPRWPRGLAWGGGRSRLNAERR